MPRMGRVVAPNMPHHVVLINHETEFDFVFREGRFYSTQINSFTNQIGIRQGKNAYEALKRAGKAAEKRFSNVSSRYEY